MLPAEATAQATENYTKLVNPLVGKVVTGAEATTQGTENYTKLVNPLAGKGCVGVY